MEENSTVSTLITILNSFWINTRLKSCHTEEGIDFRFFNESALSTNSQSCVEIITLNILTTTLIQLSRYKQISPVLALT